jgi:hypothetical protein
MIKICSGNEGLNPKQSPALRAKPSSCVQYMHSAMQDDTGAFQWQDELANRRRCQRDASHWTGSPAGKSAGQSCGPQLALPSDKPRAATISAARPGETRCPQQSGATTVGAHTAPFILLMRRVARRLENPRPDDGGPIGARLTASAAAAPTRPATQYPQSKDGQQSTPKGARLPLA